MLKKLVIGLCQTFLLLVIVGGVLIGYAAFAERSATRRADSLCSIIKRGALTAGIREQAISLGAEERGARWVTDPHGEERLVAIFPGFTPISRHICNVTAKDGHVTQTEVTYLD
jgi:hypothetical protein